MHRPALAALLGLSVTPLTLAACSDSGVTAVGCGSYVDYGTIEAGAEHADLVARAVLESVTDAGDSAGIGLTLEEVVKGKEADPKIVARVDLNCDTPSDFVPSDVKVGDEVIVLLVRVGGQWSPMHTSGAISEFDQATLDAIQS